MQRGYMNTRAQIGKLISIFPIMLLIFIIMGIFVLLSSAFSLPKIVDVQQVNEIVNTPKGDLLDRVISFDDEEKTIREALIEFGNSYKPGNPDDNLNRAGLEQLKNGLRSIVISDEADIGAGKILGCAVIYGQVSGKTPFIYSLPFNTKDYGNGIFVIFAQETAIDVRYTALTSDLHAKVEGELPVNRVELQLNSGDYEVYYYYWECNSPGGE